MLIHRRSLAPASTSFPCLRAVIVPLLMALLGVGCASQQDLQHAGKEADLDEFKSLSENFNPYKANEDGEIPFRKLLNAYDDDKPEWINARLEESTKEAQRVLHEIEEGQLSPDAFERMMTDGTPFYPDAVVDEVLGNTLVHELTHEDFTEYLKALIPASPDLNSQNEFGATPLHQSITQGRSHVRDLLIQSGANLDSQEFRGWTPLMNAAYYGKVKAIETFINAGADLNIKNDRGRTALHFTANDSNSGNREHDPEIAEKLIANGADVDALNYDVATPLILTATFDRPKVAKVLLEGGASIDVEDGHDRTIEEVARANDNFSIIATIREAQRD